MDFSSSSSSLASQNNPTWINIGGSTSPVMWLIIGLVVVVGLIIWLKKGKR